jgi:hypothetical protein
VESSGSPCDLTVMQEIKMCLWTTDHIHVLVCKSRNSAYKCRTLAQPVGVLPSSICEIEF